MKNSPPKSIPPATMLYEVSRGRKYSAQPRHMIDTSTQYEREYFIPSLANHARTHVSQAQPIPGEGAPISPCLTDLFPRVDCCMFEDAPLATPDLGEATTHFSRNSFLRDYFARNQLPPAPPLPLPRRITVEKELPLVDDCLLGEQRDLDEQSSTTITIRSLVGTTRSSQSGFVLPRVSSIVTEILSSDVVLSPRDALDEPSATTITLRSLVGTTRSSQFGFVLPSVPSIVTEILSLDSLLPSRDEHETSVTASQGRYRPAG